MNRRGFMRFLGLAPLVAPAAAVAAMPAKPPQAVRYEIRKGFQLADAIHIETRNDDQFRPLGAGRYWIVGLDIADRMVSVAVVDVERWIELGDGPDPIELNVIRGERVAVCDAAAGAAA